MHAKLILAIALAIPTTTAAQRDVREMPTMNIPGDFRRHDSRMEPRIRESEGPWGHDWRRNSKPESSPGKSANRPKAPQPPLPDPTVVLASEVDELRRKAAKADDASALLFGICAAAATKPTPKHWLAKLAHTVSVGTCTWYAANRANEAKKLEAEANAKEALLKELVREQERAAQKSRDEKRRAAKEARQAAHAAKQAAREREAQEAQRQRALDWKRDRGGPIRN